MTDNSPEFDMLEKNEANKPHDEEAVPTPTVLESVQWNLGEESLNAELLDGRSEAADGELTAGDVLSEEETEIADAELGPAEFIEASQAKSIVESLLFSSTRPVGVATIKQIFKGSNIRTRDITRILDELASEYAGASRGVSLEEVNGGYQLRTKIDNAEFLKRLHKNRPFRLSGPALETLSIIAYKQPVPKIEVDQIRGVESGHLIRALLDRGLVSFQGKSELPGKPMLYGTTKKFLETFGLRNLKELPTLSEIDELLPSGIGDEAEEDKPKLSSITDQLANHVGSTYSEGEEELEKITNTLGSIDTRSEFFEQEKQRERERRDAERAQNIREALAVGESVEEKDQKWLSRYEAKLAQAAAAAVTDEQFRTQVAELSQESTPIDLSTAEYQAEVEFELEDDFESVRDDFDESSEENS